MTDSLWYDESGMTWVVTTGGDRESPGTDVRVELTDDQESHLNQRHTYECDYDEATGKVEIGPAEWNSGASSHA